MLPQMLQNRILCNGIGSEHFRSKMKAVTAILLSLKPFYPNLQSLKPLWFSNCVHKDENLSRWIWKEGLFLIINSISIGLFPNQTPQTVAKVKYMKLWQIQWERVTASGHLVRALDPQMVPILMAIWPLLNAEQRRWSFEHTVGPRRLHCLLWHQH